MIYSYNAINIIWKITYNTQFLLKLIYKMAKDLMKSSLYTKYATIIETYKNFWYINSIL